MSMPTGPSRPPVPPVSFVPHQPYQQPYQPHPPHPPMVGVALPQVVADPVPQRPAAVTTSVTLTITGSLLFGCSLALLWLLAWSARSELAPAAGESSVLFHLAERFHLHLSQGLAVPLFGFPVAATVVAFLVPGGARWARWLLTGVGVAALAWSAWWLRFRLGWWVPGAVYIGVASAILWLPAVSRWYAAGAGRSQNDRYQG